VCVSVEEKGVGVNFIMKLFGGKQIFYTLSKIAKGGV